jgi:starch synthase
VGDNFLKIATITEALKEKDLALYAGADNISLQTGGASFADAISFGEENVPEKLKAEFSKVKGKKILAHSGHPVDLTEYLQLYNDLAGH